MGKWTYTEGIHKISDGIHAYLQPPGALGGSNSGCITEGGESLLVDTFYDLEHTDAMLRSLKGIPGALPVKYLVNTHVDGDHTFGNQLIEGAEIIASEACRDEFEKDLGPELYEELLRKAPHMGKIGKYFLMALGRYNFKDIRLTPPTRSFKDRMDVQVGSKEVNLIEVGPAHTSGDIIVYVPADRVLFSGDVVFTSITPVSWCGPSTNLIKAMDTILGLEVDVLVPGHGPISDQNAARLMRDYWEYTAEEGKKRYDRGMSALEAGKDLAENGRFSHLPLPVVNIINLHMLFKEFSGDNVPLDKFAILGQVADLLIPD